MNLNQNIIKKTYIFFISFLFIFFSCNSDDDHNVAVTGVNLDKEELSLEVGAESTLIATVTPTTATNKKVTWSSDKPIATVDNGLVTAVAIGTATITVTASADNTKTDTVTVTVTSTLTEFSIADVNVPRGTTSFVISPTLIPTEATVDYELITKPTGVTMAGTTINIAADMVYGEYNITLKAKGTGDYTGEIETTFTLYLGIFLNDDFVINFTDKTFKDQVKKYLNITANEVTYGDVKNVTQLDVSSEIGTSSYITNMEEIRYFDSLITLFCRNNQLTSLDISQNTVLEELDCGENQLTSLDLSQNTVLEELDCGENQLTSLDLSQNTVLTTLYCQYNQLTSLDFSQNVDLVALFCFTNQLTSLDLRQNTVLKVLSCGYNQLTSLDLSQNTVLEKLYCRMNKLTNLDVSRNTVLKDLYCYDNQLTSLDLSQNTDLNRLYCYDNQLTSLDLSKNTNLKYLYCYDNQLTSLDLSKNTVLEYLQCYDNQLTSLDISQSTVLKDLYCYDNQLTSLDLSQNTVLEYLQCHGNQLTSLDISQSTVLKILYCYDNQLTSLDLSQNTDLDILRCKGNQLTSLDIRGVRGVDKFLSFSNTTLQTFKVHQNIKDHKIIIDLKTDRGNDVTISTYSASAGSTTYNLMCNDYVPGEGAGSCND